MNFASSFAFSMFVDETASSFHFCFLLFTWILESFLNFCFMSNLQKNTKNKYFHHEITYSNKLYFLIPSCYGLKDMKQNFWLAFYKPGGFLWLNTSVSPSIHLLSFFKLKLEICKWNIEYC